MLSFVVGERRREFGIRFALGARRGEILALVLRQAGMRALIGIAAGTVTGVVAARFLRAQLHEVSPTDTRTLAAGGALLMLTALVAAALPARAAARVDPARSMRAD